MTSKNQRGFTLIELLLAMAFMSFLLLFVVSSLLQVTRLYSKGLAVRQINQTGRQVLQSLTYSVRYATPTYIAANNRLCVGGTSYAWNLDGQTINAFASPNAAEPLRFISQQDPAGNLCSSPGSAIAKATTKDLIGPEVTPLRFTVAQNGRLWDISLVLSTAGSNIAVAGSTPSGFMCEAANQFCAFGDFATSIYSRGR